MYAILAGMQFTHPLRSQITSKRVFQRVVLEIRSHLFKIIAGWLDFDAGHARSFIRFPEQLYIYIRSVIRALEKGICVDLQFISEYYKLVKVPQLVLEFVAFLCIFSQT